MKSGNPEVEPPNWIPAFAGMTPQLLRIKIAPFRLLEPADKKKIIFVTLWYPINAGQK